MAVGWGREAGTRELGGGRFWWQLESGVRGHVLEARTEVCGSVQRLKPQAWRKESQRVWWEIGFQRKL